MKTCLTFIVRFFQKKKWPAFFPMQENLWEENPALLFGLTVLTGISCYAFSYGWVWGLTWSLYLVYEKKAPLLLLLIASLFYFFLLKSEAPTNGVGYFSISTLKSHHSPFHKMLQYQGVLSSEKGQIPCSIYSPMTKKHPEANCDYVVEGTIKETPQGVILKPKSWHKIQNSWSIGELRYQAKEAFRKFLEKHLHKEDVASFLGSLITGDVEKRELRYQFSKLGLQHLLAISGFHFALLIFFFSLFLDLFLNPKVKIIALLLLIHFYFFFVGSVPSVQRSYLIALFYLTALLIDRHASPLNLLGAAMLIECLINPSVITSIGFQLSFVSSGGILLLYRPIERFFLGFLTPSEDLNFIAQHGRVLSLFLLRGVSLSLAVNLAILPILLTHFHSFPLLSLFYNLFFPLLVSIALFMLLISILSHFVFPPISQLFFTLTDLFTKELLDLVRYPPVSLDVSLRVSEFPALLIPMYLFALFSFSSSQQEKHHEKFSLIENS